LPKISIYKEDTETGRTEENSDAFEKVPNSMKASVRLQNLTKVNYIQEALSLLKYKVLINFKILFVENFRCSKQKKL